MTDHDLSRLKELPVPSPREGSKATAVNAALEAYSLSRGRLANVKPVSALFEKAQGSFALGRPTDASATAGRSKSMRYRLPMAIAATVAAVSIAVPVTLHLTKGTTSSLFGQLSQEPSSPPPLIDEQRRMEQVQVAQPRPASAPISFAAVPASTATHQLYDRSPFHTQRNLLRVQLGESRTSPMGGRATSLFRQPSSRDATASSRRLPIRSRALAASRSRPSPSTSIPPPTRLCGAHSMPAGCRKRMPCGWKR
jgi:hypothetical protein